MILDEQSIFSDNQQVLASSASTNILELGKHEMAYGTPVELYIQITESFNNLTSLTINVQTSEDENFSTKTDLIEQTIPLENLKKGNTSSIKFLPKGNLGYMRLYYTVIGGAPTQGSVFAGITDGTQEGFHNI